MTKPFQFTDFCGPRTSALAGPGRERPPFCPRLSWFWATALAVVLAAGSARADFNPVPLAPSSFNQDIVVEKLGPIPIGRATTASMDSGTNNNQDSWYEIGFNTSAPATGLPAAGSTFTSASLSTHAYRMAPTYATNNALLIDAGIRAGTWTLTTPAAYANLSFLTSGGHNGLGTIGVVVHHQDGSIEHSSFASPDWYNGASPAYTSNGRVDVQSFVFDTGSINSGNPRLYSRDVTVANTTSPVVSIDLTNQSTTGGDVGVFAVSGEPPGGSTWSPIAVTGYTADMIVEASAPHPALLSGVTTASMDGGTANNGNTFFEAGYDPFFPRNGLPPAGSSITSSNQPDHHYILPASYEANNAAMVDPSSGPVTLTPATPARFSALSFLGAAANGLTTVGCAVQHQDGSTENFTMSLPDWVSGSPVAYYVNGRLTLDTRAITNENVTPAQVRLFEPQVALGNTVSPVTSVTLNWQSGAGNSRAAFFAMSGTAGTIPPIIADSPQSVVTYDGPDETFSVTLGGGTPPLTYQWQKGTNGVYANLSDGGNISGAHSTNLIVSAVGILDSGDYRLVVSNVLGAVNSGVANLLVVSSLPVVTTPSDAITLVGSTQASPVGEGVNNAIDQTTSKYLNFANGTSPYTGVAGFVVTPGFGASRVTVMRVYTANDHSERDPAAFTIEGSNDGGNSFLPIASGSLSLPEARNAVQGLPIDPLTQPMQQVSFDNLSSFTSYRVLFTQVKNASLANSCQVGEVELLGNSVNLSLSVSPTFQNFYANSGGTAQFYGSVSPVDPSTSLQWEKWVNGAYVPLTDNSSVSGSTTETLTINNVQFSDEANYVLMVSNSSAVVASQPSFLNVLSQGADVTAPGDPISIYGAVLASPLNEGVTNAIDNTSDKFLCYGNGALSPTAYAGPAGFVVTPAKGKTVVTGLRVYTANDNPPRDPADYTLEGSNDGGATFSLIATGPLTLPVDRNDLSLATDPLGQPNQEVRFANAKAYATYRFSVRTVRNSSSATSMQFAEVELLGGTSVTITLSHGAGGSLTLSSSVAGELFSTTSLSNPVWVDEGPINGSVAIVPSASTPAKFYRVKAN